MAVLLSIDPSMRNLGWALWRDGQLVTHGLRRFPPPPRGKKGGNWTARCDVVAAWVVKQAGVLGAECLVSEIPQVFRFARRGKAGLRNESVQRLYFLVGMIAGRALSAGYPISLVKPSTWKGTLPKEVTQRRMAKMYGVSPTLNHNVADAIGIGDWYLRKRHLRPE